MELRRLFLLGAAALACVAALLAIVTLLRGDFGETEGDLFATIGATFVAISAVAAGAALLERGIARPLGLAGLVLACAGFVLWTEQIWAEHHSERYWKVLWLLLAWTLAVLLATTTRLLTRTERLARTLFPTTAGAAGLAALVATVMILREAGGGWQLLGVLLVLALLGQVLTPLLGRAGERPAGTTGERVLGTVAGASVVAVQGDAGGRIVRIGEREVALGAGETVHVRPA
ncbi:MAG: hypothetical protein ABR521_01300 [Gaiellaceae bacterium]